ncbi:MAG: mechanosensitive ion channel domain-containing protein [Cyanobacteria bacterium P01_H01_bin.121]
MEWLQVWAGKAFEVLERVLTTPFLSFGGEQLSLGYLFILILFAFAVFFLARRVSDWLKKTLLVRFGLERGAREAIAAIASYILAIFGFLTVLQATGLDLSSLTVFAGVAGIGIGFGLQTLTSNFFSGITLLLEQPIRVGDFVQLEDLQGTVEKISIRATTICTLDGIFIIIPNNRFIENDVVNWSYRDPNCRLHVPIGVAYGSDPLLVTEALLAAARQETSALSYPAPQVWLRSFGDNALNFELLIWISQPQFKDPITSSLNYLINQELQCRNIKIPFPQRDLWLRNPQDLALAVNPELNLAQLAEHIAPKPEPEILPRSHWPLREALRRLDYFTHCTDAELRYLIENGYRQTLSPGQAVFKELEEGKTFYLILAGSVEIISQALKQRFATLHEGDFFGELSVLLGTPRSATVVTLENTTLFVIDHHNLQGLLRSHAELADQIAARLAEFKPQLEALGLTGDGLPGSQQGVIDRVKQRLFQIFNI